MSKVSPSAGKKAASVSAPSLDASHVWENYRTPAKASDPDHGTNISKAASVWTRYTDGRMKQFGSR